MRSPSRFLVTLALLAVAPALAAEPVPSVDPQVLLLDGQKVPLSSLQKPLTVLLLWTSMCADPALPLQSFDALAARYLKDPRVALLSVSIDNPKGKEDLEVIEEITAPLKLRTRVIADQGFGVMGLAEGKDFGGKPPTEVRVLRLVVFREGKVVHLGNLSSTAGGDEVIAQYVPVLDAELAKLPKPRKTKATRSSPPAGTR